MWTVLLLACASSTSAEGKPPPAPGHGSSGNAAAAAQPPPKGFPCCADPAAQQVVDAYLPVQRALVRSDAAAASAAATTLATVAEGAGAADIVPLARAVQGAELKSVRAAFKPLSAAVVRYAREHTGGALTVAEAWCPMAPGGGGGWLQTEGEIRNPYYGDEMLTCGSFR